MHRTSLGLSAIALAIGFNIPFALLAGRFDYPDILRQPADQVLQAFAAGGPALVLIWYAFALSAMALIPFSIALAFASPGQNRLGLSVGVAITGSLAGFAQALGLIRWVFAVPMIAAAHVAPGATEAQRAATETAFVLLNQWGGVGVGEHMGQLLTVLWIALSALLRAHRGSGWLARAETLLAAAAILGIGIGLGEGLALVTGGPAEAFALFTIAGYMAFTLWLILVGINLIRRPA